MRKTRRLLVMLMVFATLVSSCSCSLFKKKAKLKVGDELKFGTYNGDPIEWQVIEVNEEGEALIISKYALDMREYSKEHTPVTWAESDTRGWLNGEFYDTSFTDKEKKEIVVSHLTTAANRDFDTEGGEDTDDKIFLLSAEESEKYFPTNEERLCYPTEHCIKSGVWVSDYAGFEGTCCWWLRTTGKTRYLTAFVYVAGNVFFEGARIFSHYLGIRPAMRIKA